MKSCIKIFKDPQRFFNLGSSSETIRKHVWYFGSTISSFIFEAIQKYSNAKKIFKHNDKYS